MSGADGEAAADDARRLSPSELSFDTVCRLFDTLRKTRKYQQRAAFLKNFIGHNIEKSSHDAFSVFRLVLPKVGGWVAAKGGWLGGCGLGARNTQLQLLGCLYSLLFVSACVIELAHPPITFTSVCLRGIPPTYPPTHPPTHPPLGTASLTTCAAITSCWRSGWGKRCWRQRASAPSRRQAGLAVRCRRPLQEGGA